MFPSRQVQNYAHGFGDQGCPKSGAKHWEVAAGACADYVDGGVEYMVCRPTYFIKGVRCRGCVKKGEPGGGVLLPLALVVVTEDAHRLGFCM